MSRFVATAVAGVVLAASVVVPAAAAFTTTPEIVGDVTGLAWDQSTDRVWFAGDPADSGTLVGLTEDGEQAQITWAADLVDVQALASLDGELFVGDIGNPDLARSTVTVYRFRDMMPGQKQYRAYELRYEDGNHDAAAMAVAPDGTILVITRGDDPGIYRAGPDPSRTTVDELARVADAPGDVIDAVYLIDDDQLALRTGSGVEVVDPESGEALASDTFATEMPDEAITVREGQLLLAGPAEMRVADVPASDTTSTPTGAASPASTPSPTEAATAAGSEQSPSTPVPTNRGTFIALGLAGLVAVLAAAVTYFVRS